MHNRLGPRRRTPRNSISYDRPSYPQPRSPDTLSVGSHFTSVSQRGINPQWRDEPQQSRMQETNNNDDPNLQETPVQAPRRAGRPRGSRSRSVSTGASRRSNRRRLGESSVDHSTPASIDSSLPSAGSAATSTSIRDSARVRSIATGRQLSALSRGSAYNVAYHQSHSTQSTEARYITVTPDYSINRCYITVTADCSYIPCPRQRRYCRWHNTIRGPPSTSLTHPEYDGSGN